MADAAFAELASAAWPSPPHSPSPPNPAPAPAPNEAGGSRTPAPSSSPAATPAGGTATAEAEGGLTSWVALLRALRPFELASTALSTLHVMPLFTPSALAAALAASAAALPGETYTEEVQERL